MVPKYLVIFGIFIFSFKGAAENGFIAATANQVYQGSYCSDVKMAEVTGSCLSCSPMAKNEIKNAGPGVYGLLEKLIFDQAVKDQIIKNQCMGQQVQALKNDPKKKKQWMSFLAAAWLGKKKAQLMLKACEWVITNPGTQSPGYSLPQKSNLSDFEKKRIETRDKLDAAIKGLESTCKDKKTMAALFMSNDLFQFSVPIISAPSLFDAVENSRDHIINKKTGKPVTDYELMNSDISNLDFISLNVDGSFESGVVEALDGIAKDREKITTKLQGSIRGDKAAEPNADLKDYMFEDGTVNLVMQQAKLMDEDDDKKSAGAQCLLARYEKRFGGELTDFATTSAVGGYLFRSYKWLSLATKEALAAWGLARDIKLTNDLAKATAFKKLKESMKFGALMGGAKLMLNDFYNACRSETYHSKKAGNMSQSDADVSIMSDDLPKSVGYDRWNMKLNEKDIPACKQAAAKNLLQNSAHDSSCAWLIMTSLVPMKYAIPLSAMGN